mgnify:CR=1 FL=1
MKQRSLLLIAVVCGFAVMFAAIGIAGTTVEDVIIFKPIAGEGKYQDRTVTFTHKKHIEEHKVACGECHHDENGKPLTDLKMGDDVQKCIECHTKPGEVPKDVKMEWRKKKVKRSEQKTLSLEYHAEAFHENCVDCHKDHNRKNKTKAAPQACTQCHEKSE